MHIDIPASTYEILYFQILLSTCNSNEDINNLANEETSDDDGVAASDGVDDISDGEWSSSREGVWWPGDLSSSICSESQVTGEFYNTDINDAFSDPESDSMVERRRTASLMKQPMRTTECAESSEMMLRYITR